MKTIFLLITFFSLCYCLSAQTQSEMNAQAYNNYKKADAKLNKTYQQLLKVINKKEKEKLVKAQKAWIKFRDSDCDFQAEENDGGSIQPMIWAMCLEEKTKARIKDFKDKMSSYNIK